MSSYYLTLGIPYAAGVNNVSSYYLTLGIPYAAGVNNLAGYAALSPLTIMNGASTAINGSVVAGTVPVTSTDYVVAVHVTGTTASALWSSTIDKTNFTDYTVWWNNGASYVQLDVDCDTKSNGAWSATQQTVWFKLQAPIAPGAASTDYIVAVGNSAPIAMQNWGQAGGGGHLYPFADDFLGNSLTTQWISAYGASTKTITNSTITITSAAGTGGGGIASYPAVWGGNYQLCMWGTLPPATSTGNASQLEWRDITASGTSTNFIDDLLWDSGNWKLRYVNPGYTAGPNLGAGDNAYHYFTLARIPAGVWGSVDAVSSNWSSVHFMALAVWLFPYAGGTTDQSISADWIKVRPWVVIEPTVTVGAPIGAYTPAVLHIAVVGPSLLSSRYRYLPIHLLQSASTSTLSTATTLWKSLKEGIISLPLSVTLLWRGRTTSFGGASWSSHSAALWPLVTQTTTHCLSLLGVISAAKASSFINGVKSTIAHYLLIQATAPSLAKGRAVLGVSFAFLSATIGGVRAVLGVPIAFLSANKASFSALLAWTSALQQATRAFWRLWGGPTQSRWSSVFLSTRIPYAFKVYLDRMSGGIFMAAISKTTMPGQNIIYSSDYYRAFSVDMTSPLMPGEFITSATVDVFSIDMATLVPTVLSGVVNVGSINVLNNIITFTLFSPTTPCTAGWTYSIRVSCVTSTQETITDYLPTLSCPQ